MDLIAVAPIAGDDVFESFPSGGGAPLENQQRGTDGGGELVRQQGVGGFAPQHLFGVVDPVAVAVGEDVVERFGVEVVAV